MSHDQLSNRSEPDVETLARELLYSAQFDAPPTDGFVRMAARLGLPASALGTVLLGGQELARAHFAQGQLTQLAAGATQVPQIGVTGAASLANVAGAPMAGAVAAGTSPLVSVAATGTGAIATAVGPAAIGSAAGSAAVGSGLAGSTLSAWSAGSVAALMKALGAGLVAGVVTVGAIESADLALQDSTTTAAVQSGQPRAQLEHSPLDSQSSRSSVRTGLTLNPSSTLTPRGGALAPDPLAQLEPQLQPQIDGLAAQRLSSPSALAQQSGAPLTPRAALEQTAAASRGLALRGVGENPGEGAVRAPAAVEGLASPKPQLGHSPAARALASIASATAGAPTAVPPFDSGDKPSALRMELAKLSEARSFIQRNDGHAALGVLEHYWAQFPRGALQSEALLLRVEAQLILGNRALASESAEALMSQFPRSPHLKRLRQLGILPEHPAASTTW